MWILDWIGSGGSELPEPRSFEEIRADIERRDAVHLQRLNRVEESLFALTAEAGLEDLRRRMEERRGD